MSAGREHGPDTGAPGGFLGALTPDEARDLRGLGRTRRFARGTTLFVEGDRSERVALVVAGRVKVSSFTRDGREIVLAVRRPGDLLGEFSAIDDEPLSATCTAMDSVEAVILPAGDFRAYLERHPRVTLTMLRAVTLKLRDADRKRIEFGAFDTVGRVARRVVELAGEFGRAQGDSVRIDLPLSQQELAGWTGASREAVSKALQMLRARGWIETHRRGITVLDLEGLARRAR